MRLIIVDLVLLVCAIVLYFVYRHLKKKKDKKKGLEEEFNDK